MLRWRLLVGLLIAGSAALLAYGLTTFRLTHRLLAPLELTTLDWRVRSVAQPPRERSEVVLVLFDSAAVRDWPYLVPFPRTVLADLIDVVAGAGARAIGLDVLLDRRYPELDVLGNGDERLRDAIQRAGNVVLVAKTEETSNGRVLVPPDPYFAEVAAGFATADLPTPYETVRDAVFTVRTDRGLVAGLPVALYAAGRGIPLDSLLSEADQTGLLGIPGLPAPHHRLPRAAAAQSVPILFVGPPSRTDRDDGAFAAFSSFAILHLGAFTPPEWFRDKIVLLGSGFHPEDRFRTPFYEHSDAAGTLFGWTYGVEVQANALENLLTGSYLVPLGTTGTLALLFLVALLVTLVSMLRGIAWGAATAVTLLVGCLVLAWRLFDAGDIHIPVVAPTLALVFAVLGSSSYISLVEGKEKRAIRDAFSKYVAPTIVDELTREPSRLRLGGEKRTVTLLFSDLEGFTSMAERMDPERLVSLLNRYLDDMTNIVLAEGGTLDKYVGDGIMAFFGAPTAQPDHALRACRAAILMQQRLQELNREWTRQNWPELRMRIGINTGAPIVGNIGGEKRFDYTALGDAVNLAARLEPACKTYGVSTIISEETRLAARDTFIVRELDRIVVYGKVEPVRIYELVGLQGQDLGRKVEVLAYHALGLEAFHRHDFSLALGYFQAAVEVDPEDGPARLYLERCRQFMISPPPIDWDFVERRQFK